MNTNKLKEVIYTKYYNTYKTKRSINKKIKTKSYGLDNFIIEKSDNYGIVIEVKYNDVYVLYDDKIVLAKPRKDLNIVSNKLLFPGDKVVIAKDSSDYIINYLIKRTTSLSRIKKDNARKKDIGLKKYIATNVDIAVIVVSAKTPPLHPKFIDRYLTILESSNIPAIICLNKSDLKTETEDNILSIYKDLNIPVVETSTYNHMGIENLKEYLKGKQTIFVGNSGVGKSSLTNALMEDEKIKTNNVGNKSKRGKHTTTSSKYYIWNNNSSIIDTPGIRSLDVSSFSPIEVQNYFPELEGFKDKCRYKDCLHYLEPLASCSVKKAVKDGLISCKRYESYLRIMEDILGDNKSEEIINEIFLERGQL